jgi:small acid-soluble spore protein (thioredoxin-like protein)
MCRQYKETVGGSPVKPNPDNRKDNVERIQKNISNTIRNIEMAEEMMAKTDNPKTIEELRIKNERRREALDGLRKEIKDENDAREKGYKS